MALYKSPIHPYDPVIEIDKDTGRYRYIRDNFFGAGMRDFDQAPAESQELFALLENVMPVATGVFTRRWGVSSFSTPGSDVFTRSFEYQNDDTGVRRLVFCSDTAGPVALTETGSMWNSSIFTPTAGYTVPYMVNSRDFAYFTDSKSADLLKWDGSATSGVSKWGITAPATAVSVGVPTSGAITLNTGRNYFLVYRNNTTGHMSDLSPVSASTGPLTAQEVPLSNVPVSADPQVDKKWLLATVDGGDQTTLYFLVELNNADTSYTDNTLEEDLLNANVVLEIDDNGNPIGVADNTPPPNGSLPIKYKGRLCMAIGQALYFSKSDDELVTSTGLITGKYEESWPATYFFDISEGAETVRALISTGDAIYIGTQRHIRRVTGDGPLNFQKPEIVFNEVGVLNDEVFRPVFVQGRPVGMMWITPDLKVILSDFNTYQDVGTAIQATLNTINLAAIDSSWAMFAANNAYDVYILAIPTGSNTTPDTLCVFDMRSQQWMVWTPYEHFTTGISGISITDASTQWLVAGTSGNVWAFKPTNTQDNSNNIPVTIRTPWLHLGQPTARKFLNELELVCGAYTRVTIEMASTSTEFSSPTVLKSSATPTTSLLGPLKVFLSGTSPQKGRYIRLTFTNSSEEQLILGSYNIEVSPVHNV